MVARWDEVFRAVSAGPRRRLLVALTEAGPADAVALPEAATNPALDTDPESLRIELYHRHLPMLADRGFVRWEFDPLVATRGPRFDEVAAVFEALTAHASELPADLVVGCEHLETPRD